MTDLGLPFAVVVTLWFVSTGLVAMLNHRLRQSLARTLAISGVCAIGGLSLVVLTSNVMADWAIYASFVGGLLIWSWHEISFLTGAVAGSHRDPCPQGAKGWERFSAATTALIHHEIALAMTAGLLLSLAAFTGNATGAYTFALLLIFRLSSKLNIYWGVPNMSDELLPKHMAYLKSYFGPKRLRPILLLSIAAIGGLAIYFALAASAATISGLAIQNALLCCLCLLAALEHIFLAIPFRDSALWQWALDGRADRTEG
ncbi:putative photosynthetic complex assembly protein PuhE [Pontixanthobacter aestiaquae]|uniref:putative photosynthetic complex assembly protein PuhE n=1 Tax=Pontixanthobacter aestiaquae TaxID=1509367 RepID=UPI002E25C3A4|nr:putative photosynthetic complex assembly protein PuhE [Pontixanthobacter aestiaquae]